MTTDEFVPEDLHHPDDDDDGPQAKVVKIKFLAIQNGQVKNELEVSKCVIDYSNNVDEEIEKLNSAKEKLHKLIELSILNKKQRSKTKRDCQLFDEYFKSRKWLSKIVEIKDLWGFIDSVEFVLIDKVTIIDGDRLLNDAGGEEDYFIATCDLYAENLAKREYLHNLEIENKCIDSWKDLWQEIFDSQKELEAGNSTHPQPSKQYIEDKIGNLDEVRQRRLSNELKEVDANIDRSGLRKADWGELKLLVQKYLAEEHIGSDRTVAKIVVQRIWKKIERIDKINTTFESVRKTIYREDGYRERKRGK